MDTDKIIEKHILRYILIHNEYEFEGDPKFELFRHLSSEIENELNDAIIFREDFNNVFYRLVDKKALVIKYKDENSFIKKGTIKENISFHLLDYMIENEYVNLKDSFQYSYERYIDEIKIRVLQIQQMKEIEEKLKKQEQDLLDRIQEQDKQIKNFYNNILSILGILVAVFSIIGFNIGGIKFIVGQNETLKPWTYAGSIGVVNVCIVLSIYFLFLLVNNVINGKQNNQGIFSKQISLCLFAILLLIIFVCFIIA